MSRRVHVFGALRVEQNGQPVKLVGGKLVSLFAYLLLHPHRLHSREKLADVLSPDTFPDRAARNFTALLYRLRQTLGADWLDVNEEQIALCAAPDLWVDAWEFERLAASSDPEAQRQAVALYHDDLLPEIYDDWILPLRVALREKFLQTLVRLAEGAEQAQDNARAFEYYHRLAFAEPLNEDAQRGLMRVYARTGRHAAALQQYARLERTLADELGVEPQAETRALVEAIRIEHESGAAHVVEERPFVGRQRERARLLALIERAQSGRGGLAFVEGEAGIGKTRLLENVAEGAAWRGMTVVWGRGRELTGLAPFAPLDEALRAACAGPRADQLRTRLSPALCHALAGIEPRLRTSTPIANPPDIADALAEGVCALAGLAPHLFIFDDVQWAEASFWDALEKLVSRVETQRLCLLLAYRADELRANETAWRALRQLDREFAPLRLVLAGLSEAESLELTRALGQPLDEASGRALHRRANGNPLFLRTLLQAGESGQASYAELLERRLSRLDETARGALEAGAVLGSEFTHGAWQSIAGPSALEAIPVLFAERFLQESENGYRFEHDLTREFVYHAINGERRRVLHRRAGAVLAQEHAEPSELAWHFEQGEDWEKAARYYRQAGERAANRYAYRAAYELFTRGLTLAARLPNPDAERLPFLSGRSRVLEILVRVPELRSDLDEIEKIAARWEDDSTRLEIMEARLRLAGLKEDVDEALTIGAQAIEWARRIQDHAAEARIHKNLGMFLVSAPGQPKRAIAHLERAATLARQQADTAFTVQTLAWLSYACVRAEKCRQGLAYAQEALQLAAGREYTLERAYAFYALGAAKWYLAEWQEARAALHAARELCREAENWRIWGDVTFDLAIVASSMGQHAEARQLLDSLLDMEEQSKFDPHSSVRMWGSTMSARLYLWAGDLTAAERVMGGLRAWMETADELEPLQDAFTVLGRLRLAQGRPQDALAPLRRAIEISVNILKNDDAAALLLHAIAAQQTGDHAAARTSLARAEEIMSGSDAARHNVLRHYASYVVSGAPADLEAARAEIRRQAALFTDEALRAAFLNNVALHREVEAKWQALHPAPPRMSVRLARADVPLGRALTEADFVTVQWTVDAGEEDAALLQREGKVALRRHRLARLMREAREQNAAPTDGDLARALGVNIRTIERDIAAMRSAGDGAKTRRRK